MAAITIQVDITALIIPALVVTESTIDQNE
jgi:hypothetical protein